MNQAPYTLNAQDLDFPPVELALSSPDGLLATGGDLRVERLLEAYRQGIFPWYNDDQPILWWSPDPRTVLEFDKLHTSRSLLKTIKSKPYDVFFDRNFKAVIEACQQPRQKQHGTWITDEMKSAYLRLFEQGYAHCVEVELEGQVIGGLYGVSIGHAFFGESMFNTASNGSKLALYFLVERLKEWEFTWLDCQVWSDHLATLGCETIPRKAFIRKLRNALIHPTQKGPWQACAPK